MRIENKTKNTTFFVHSKMIILTPEVTGKIILLLLDGKLELCTKF